MTAIYFVTNEPPRFKRRYVDLIYFNLTEFLVTFGVYLVSSNRKLCVLVNVTQCVTKYVTVHVPVSYSVRNMCAVTAASGAPVVLLLFNAGPLNISWAKSSAAVNVIMECFFPAQATGDALINVIYNNAGAMSNPAGRLPITWPQNLQQVRDSDVMFNVHYCSSIETVVPEILASILRSDGT